MLKSKVHCKTSKTYKTNKTEVKHEMLIPSFIKRIEEKKIRNYYLTQKYGEIYITKVFGKVHPSQAERYYTTKLMSTVFCSWKLFWWQAQVEWRLELRANCYHRFNLVKNAFTSWQTYVTEKHLVIQREIDAVNHYNAKIKRKVVHYLNYYSKISRCLEANSRMKLEIYEIIIAKCKVLCTKQEVIKHHMHKLAVTFWSLKLLRKCWITWRQCMEIQEMKQKKLICIFEIKGIRLQQIAFQRWRQYLAMRKRNYKLIAFADKIHKERTITSYFHKWNMRYKNSIWHKAISIHVENLYANKIKHRYFNYWRQYAKLERRNRELDLFVNMKLKRKVLKCLKLFASKMIQQRSIKCLETLKHVWRLWTAKVEQSKDLQVWSQINDAIHHYRQKLIKRCLRILKAHAVTKKIKLGLKSKADTILYLRYLQTWHGHWQKIQYTEQLDNQKRLQAIAFHQFSCLRRVVNIWKQRYVEMIEFSELEDLAVCHQSNRKLTRYFGEWKKITQEIVEMRNFDQQAKCYHEWKLQTKYLKRWVHVLVQKKNYEEQLNRSIEHYSCTILRMALKKWKETWQQRKILNIKIACLHQRQVVERLRQYYSFWCTYTNNTKVIREKEEIATLFYTKRLTSKSLKQWTAYLVYREYKKVEKQKLCQSTYLLQKTMVTGYFHNWLIKMDQLRRIAQYHHHKLQRRYFNNWYTYKLEKATLNKKKEVLKNTYITSIYQRWFPKWCDKYRKQKELYHKEVVALVMWSSSLQRKYLEYWRIFSKKCREKRKKALIRSSLIKVEEAEKRALAYAVWLTKKEFYVARKFLARWRTYIWKRRSGDSKSKNRILWYDELNTPFNRLVNFGGVDETDYNGRYFEEHYSVVKHNQISLHNDNIERGVCDIQARLQTRPHPRIPGFLTSNMQTYDSQSNETYNLLPNVNVPPCDANVYSRQMHSQINENVRCTDTYEEYSDCSLNLCLSNVVYSNTSTSICINPDQSQDSLEIQVKLLPPSYFH